MIYNLIGSAILVAVGAAGMWAWMRHRVALLERDIELCVDDYCRVANENHGLRATISRLSDTVGRLQYKRDKTLEYCKQFRVRGAVVAGILSGEQDQ